MNEVDVMIRRKEKALQNWKEQLAAEKKLNQKRRHDITITVDTLEWFLWMIENYKGTGPI